MFRALLYRLEAASSLAPNSNAFVSEGWFVFDCFGGSLRCNETVWWPSQRVSTNVLQRQLLTVKPLRPLDLDSVGGEVD